MIVLYITCFVVGFFFCVYLPMPQSRGDMNTNRAVFTITVFGLIGTLYTLIQYLIFL